MPKRPVHFPKHEDEPDDVITGIHSYCWSDGTGPGLLTGTRGYSDPFSARAHWPEWRSRTWTHWSHDPRPYPPAAAMYHDGLGRRVALLLASIPGEGISADELSEAAHNDLSTLGIYEVPFDCAEPLEPYRRELESFAAWVDTQSGRIPPADLAFGRPWAPIIRSRRGIKAGT